MSRSLTHASIIAFTLSSPINPAARPACHSPMLCPAFISGMTPSFFNEASISVFVWYSFREWFSSPCSAISRGRSIPK